MSSIKTQLGSLNGWFGDLVCPKVQKGYDDQIGLVELLHRERMLANWSLADTMDNGHRFEVEYEPYSFGPVAKKVP